MHVYVIAPSDQGPSKIGSADDPPGRLRYLQTGSPVPLKLYHVEPIPFGALAVERAAHRALHTKRLNGEWFDIPPAEALIAIQAAAADANARLDENSTLRGAGWRAVMAWHRERERFEMERDERGDDDSEEYPVAAPDIVQSFALNTRRPSVRGFSFKDYLMTWDEGMWLRWACECMGRPMPRVDRLKPFLEIDDYLESHDVQEGRQVAERSIEWSAARALSANEANALGHVWDQFVAAYNLVFENGPQHPSHGIDDYVDDVHPYALRGDEERGDRDYVVFEHSDFRAVLLPNKRMELVKIGIRPLGGVPVSGFVAPVLTSEVWERPFLPWLRGAPERLDTALGRFLNNPNKRFPGPRPYDDSPPGKEVWRHLHRVREDGSYW